MKSKPAIKKSLFAVFVLFQIILLCSFIAVKEIRIRSGQEIIVKTVPVDPRSLFRGDYIDLNYEFSRINLKEMESPKTNFYHGQRIYVVLSQEIGYRPVWVGKAPPQLLNEDEVVIAGTVKGYGHRQQVNVSYGIESYFVPEGKGKYIEGALRKRRVTVELSLSPGGGGASVRRMFIDNQEVAFR
ncbi:GDYXXLXY domain-containing protein [Candidatus Omnitrophota bacterium]